MTPIKKIFLSGASGMVGRNLLAAPWAAQYEWLTPNRSTLDLTDAKAVITYLEAHQPDLVIHAAGRVGGIQANIRFPVDFLVENLDMGRNIVMGARQVGITRLINLGSSCMYPCQAQNPLHEEQILTGMLEPTNEGYALAKVTVARLCHYIHQQDPIYQYKTLIPCNLYGPYDKFDPHTSHLLPAIVYKLHQACQVQDQQVEIWGDGQARREFMDVTDLVHCLCEAITGFESLPEIANVGLGYDYTINTYYEVAAKIIGYNGTFWHNLDRPVGMKQKLVDISRLAAWGWKARVSLEEGITRLYDFYLNKGINECVHK